MAIDSELSDLDNINCGLISLTLFIAPSQSPRLLTNSTGENFTLHLPIESDCSVWLNIFNSWSWIDVGKSCKLPITSESPVTACNCSSIVDFNLRSARNPFQIAITQINEIAAINVNFTKKRLMDRRNLVKVQLTPMRVCYHLVFSVLSVPRIRHLRAFDQEDPGYVSN